MQVPIATRRFVFIPMDLQDLSVGLLQVPNKQWGINTGGAVRTSTLPIPFTNVFLAVASTSSEWCCPGCSATNTTVTTRAYQSNRPDVAQPNDVNWIIIGCQPQWGYSNTGKTGHITISLPISATQILMGLASYVDAIGAGDIGVYDISPTSIIIDVDSGKLGKTDFYWFVLGTV